MEELAKQVAALTRKLCPSQKIEPPPAEKPTTEAPAPDVAAHEALKAAQGRHDDLLRLLGADHREVHAALAALEQIKATKDASKPLNFQVSEAETKLAKSKKALFANDALQQ